MCLNIGTAKNNKFSICSKLKFLYFSVSQNLAYCRLIIMSVDIKTPKNHHFPFGTNEKVVVLGVPILKHFRVSHMTKENNLGSGEKIRYIWHLKGLIFIL